MRTVVPNPIDYVDKETGQLVKGYLPEGLKRDLVYHVTHTERNGWGTLVQVDRIPGRWFNHNWFKGV